MSPFPYWACSEFVQIKGLGMLSIQIIKDWAGRPIATMLSNNSISLRVGLSGGSEELWALRLSPVRHLYTLPVNITLHFYWNTVELQIKDPPRKANLDSFPIAVVHFNLREEKNLSTEDK